MAAKFYQRTKEINGVKYTAQYSGLETWLQCVDESSRGEGQAISNLKLAKNILKYGLIDPKVEVNDFETQEDLNAVIDWVQQVMQGKFRDQVDKVTAQTKSKG